MVVCVYVRSVTCGGGTGVVNFRSTSRGRDVVAYTRLSVPQLPRGDHGEEPL